MNDPLAEEIRKIIHRKYWPTPGGQCASMEAIEELLEKYDIKPKED